jgi:hypothetical protein
VAKKRECGGGNLTLNSGFLQALARSKKKTKGLTPGVNKRNVDYWSSHNAKPK